MNRDFAKTIAAAAIAGLTNAACGGSTEPPQAPEAPSEAAEATQEAQEATEGMTESATQEAAEQGGDADAVATDAEKACCKGMNACKGKGGCAVEGKHACKGMNECKGQGGCNGHCPE